MNNILKQNTRFVIELYRRQRKHHPRHSEASRRMAKVKRDYRRRFRRVKGKYICIERHDEVKNYYG